MQLVDELYVWEVCHYELEGDSDCPDRGACIDSDYIITVDAEYTDEWFDELIAAAGYTPREGTRVEVYLSRTSTLYTDKGNRLTVWEADCATGYSGSPVYEV